MALTSTETIRTIRNGELRTATSTFTQLLSSEVLRLNLPLVLYRFYKVTFLDTMANMFHELITALCALLQRFILRHQNVFVVKDRTPGSSQFCEQVTEEMKADGCQHRRELLALERRHTNTTLFRYPFHHRVTAVARKRFRSFCQKIPVILPFC